MRFKRIYVIALLFIMGVVVCLYFWNKGNIIPAKQKVFFSKKSKKSSDFVNEANLPLDSLPSSDDIFKNSVESACQKIANDNEQGCLESADLEDCYRAKDDTFSLKEKQHILSVGPQLCKAKNLYACELLLKVLSEDDSIRKQYEDALYENWKSRCQQGLDRYCKKLLQESTISPEEKAPIEGLLKNKLYKKCYEDSAAQPKDCFELSAFLNTLNLKEEAAAVYVKMKTMIHQKCVNSSILSLDSLACWLDVLDNPECWYSMEQVSCKKTYAELSETEKNSAAYFRFIQKAKEACFLSARACVLVTDAFPAHSEDKAWVQGRWFSDFVAECQNSDSVFNNACWTLYAKTHDTVDEESRQIHASTQDHLIQLGMTACQKGDLVQCRLFIFDFDHNMVKNFADWDKQAKKVLIAASQNICEKKFDYEICHSICHYGKKYIAGIS